MIGATKIAAAAVAGALSLGVTGAAALAAFQPPSQQAVVATTDTSVPSSAHAEKDRPGIRAVLDRLVQAGTITQAQADAVLKAFAEAAPQKGFPREGADVLKRVLGGMLRLSVEYIGLPHESVMGQLKAGKSLGEIADTKPGKSREGLIDFLVEELTERLDAAVAEGKITQERADQIEAGLTEKVTRFVDHTFERRPHPRTDRKPGSRPTS